MRKDMIDDMAEMLEQCGVKNVNTYDNDVLPGHGHSRDGHGAHGTRPEDVGAERAQPGVGRAERVRHRRLVHDVGRVPNPSLTYMALTARAADFAVNELNRRNL